MRQDESEELGHAAGKHEEQTRALFRAIALERQGYYDSKPGGPPRLSFWQRRIRRTVASILAERPQSAAGLHLLDAGCGRGDFTLELAAKLPAAEEVVGCDFSPELVELARLSAAAQTRVRFELADVTALPFDAGRFDVTVCLNVLHHIRADQLGLALEQLARVTAGTLLIEIKNAGSPYFRMHSKTVEGVAVYPATVEKVDERLRGLGFALAGRRAIFGLTWLSPLILLHFERAGRSASAHAGARPARGASGSRSV